MKRLFILLLLVIFIPLGSSSIFAQLKSIPSVNYRSIDNDQVVNIQDFIKANQREGKLTIISFWATWCSACENQLNHINDYYEEWSEEHNVHLIAINIDREHLVQKIKRVVKVKGWTYTFLYDSKGDSYRKFGFESLPFLLLIDEKGEIIYTKSAYRTGEEVELENKIVETKENE